MIYPDARCRSSKKIEAQRGIQLLVPRGIQWYIYIYMVPCPVFPPPPMGWGGYDAPVVVYIHTYIPTYLPTYLHTYVHTYIHTITLPYLTLPYLTLHYLTLPYIPYIHTYIHTYHYITLPYITLPYITLPYLTFHTYIHTCMHACMHTNIPTYQHTNIPTYQHTNIPTYQHTNIPPPQATGGGTRRTIPPPQATGGGTRGTIPPPQATGGGWPTLHHIYIYIYISGWSFQFWVCLMGYNRPYHPMVCNHFPQDCKWGRSPFVNKPRWGFKSKPSLVSPWFHRTTVTL